ncbi:MAG: LuxR C-terminal-related transcriptional regulator [Thermomicrobiales bacterium]
MTISVSASASGHDVSGTAIGPLPHPLTSLIGRETLIQSAISRLEQPSTRLMTFIGPGGLGKSRFALDVAHRLSRRFTDGAVLIRLAAVTDPSLVRVSIARALGVVRPGSDALAWGGACDRHMLLLIDNFEQLTAAALDIVDVLSYCPHVTMLVTSRVPLHLTGEHEFQVPPLSTPSGTAVDSDAVQLFIERASAINHEFAPTPEIREAIAEITRQLDGLPLAIELAAAQCRHLKPDLILQRLRVSSDDLQGGPIDLPLHQRAIHDTIAWSYNLLSPTEQDAFLRLAVFAGGFLSQTAESICRNDELPVQIHRPHQTMKFPNEMLDLCISLADRNLIYRTQDHHGEPRFSMLLTIRQFARCELRRLGRLEAIRRRHALWYLAFAQAARPELESDEQQPWLRWVDREHPNLRLALDWFREASDWASYARLAEAISSYWVVYGHHAEGLRWLSGAVHATSPDTLDTGLYLDLLCRTGWLAYRFGRTDEARDLADHSLGTARNANSALHLAQAQTLIGHLEVRATNYDLAGRAMRKALTIYRDLGDVRGMNETLINLGNIDLNLGRMRQAEQRFRDVLIASTSPTDVRTHARAWDMIGVALYTDGRAAEALRYAEEATSLYRQTGEVRGLAIALDHVGKCARAMGNPERAWRCHEETLPLRHEIGDPRGFSVWLEAVAALLVSCCTFEPAVEILAAVERVRSEGSFPVYGQEQHDIDWTNEQIRQNLQHSRIAILRQHGAQRSLAETIEFARSQAVIAVANGINLPVVVPDRFGLTSREKDVLDGLERRLTDREIAEELSISSRTVSTHVASILGKMNLKSRREIPESAYP